MRQDDITALSAARTALQSARRKNDKVRLSLAQAANPRAGQIARVERIIQALSISLELIDAALGSADQPVYPDQTIADSYQLLSNLTTQLEALMPKLRPGSPQHSLARRRIEAFQLALRLLEQAGAKLI